jgi:hypothetical protein
MKTIKFNNQTLFLPENWREVRMEQFQDICHLSEVLKNEDVTAEQIADSSMKIITTLADLLIEDITVAPENDIELLVKSFEWASKIEIILQEESPSDNKVVRILQLMETDYIFALDETFPLLTRQMIDIEQITNSEKYTSENIHLIIAILLSRITGPRPVFKSKKNSSSTSLKITSRELKSKYNIEKYDYDNIEEYSSILKENLSAYDTILINSLFMKFKERMFKQYAGLFGSGTGELSTYRLEFSKKWGWFAIIVNTVKDDITKIETCMDQPMALLLNFLSCKKEMADIERNEQDGNNR